MLHNQRNRHDFTGSENGYGVQPPMQPLPPKSQLDAQTERLAEQAEDIGWLKGQNDMLNEDNRRLEQENQKLRDDYRTIAQRNIELERIDAGGRASSDLILEFKESLSKKGAK